ncbi:Two-component system protein A [Cytospora mali]|uniref:Two-component system protein A n=1 Tax=Cytospora mali TaxID=578113 RepID=A0A194VXX2_CYTMA|nr:Two-component system protein A [Valsa mali]
MDADQVEGLEALAVREVLDADSRPTFVIDLDPDEPFRAVSTSISPVFCNAALRTHERLLDAVLGNAGDDELADQGDQPEPPQSGPTLPRPNHEAFKQWATGVTTHDDSKDVFPLSFIYKDLLWTGSTVRKRWRLISGNRLWHADGPPLNLASGAPLEVATGGSLATQGKRNRVVNAGDLGSAARASEANKEDTSSRMHASSSPLFYPRISMGGSYETGNSSNSHSHNRSLNITLLPERAAIDWTLPHPEGQLSEHLQYVRSIDWSATSLGAMAQWTIEFRQIANLVMMNPHPSALFCGSRLTVIYNEAYAIEVAGNKHPSLMGSDFADFFPELWDYCGPMFEESGRTGISVRKDNDYLPIYRNGMLEETYYSWTYVPIYNAGQELLGFYNGPVQTTSMVLNQRRMRTVNKIGERTGHAKTIKQFWKLVLEALDDNPRDVPFALLYSVGEDDDGDFSSVASEASISLKSCHFEGALGVPEGHVAVPQQLDLRRSLEGFVPSFREAMRTREPTLLRVKDGTLPESLLEGIEWRGFGDPCKEAIIFPVRPTNADNVLAFLVLGVNPRRPYDVEYKEFATMFNRQLATSLASTILFEEETRRIRDAVEAAVLEKERLTQQLDLQASRLRRMTELSPLGMFLITPEGVLREVNDRFFEMTGLPRSSQFEMSWMDWIMPSSTQQMEDGWQKLANEHLPWSGELQLKVRGARPRNLHGEAIDYWVLFTAQPEISPDGSLLSIMGSITNISHMKWAQGLQELQLREAEETRRQQNEFIDITSHEMRNPLSAILQCADDITSALAECHTKGTDPPRDLVDSCLESAQTISLCVQHQKSIVDDILTISKLDSNLLLITPVASQPQQVLSRAVKMFESELQAKDIKAKFEIDPPYKQFAVDWVTLDPSRVLQILINLLTNAIKFTAPSSRRVLTVAVDASLKRPVLEHIPGFQYVPSNTKTSVTATEDWGDGEVLYILFRVQDTGCGLTAEEKQILFQRFKQASPRTHAQYGGSGLGLFISKRIAELHGGQIGVASEAGSGSIFSFYIQARRSAPPVDSQMNHPLPIERHMNGDVSLRRQLTPQRQDVATTGGLGANLLATKASKALDPKAMNILIVEDNLINQRVLANQLKKIGATVSLANDGVEALEFLRTTRFCETRSGVTLDIILMDLEMPRMDGLTCVREIRRMELEGEVAGHVPVIAVTANVRAQQVTTAKDSGMDDVLSKPFRIPDLLKK